MKGLIGVRKLLQIVCDVGIMKKEVLQAVPHEQWRGDKSVWNLLREKGGCFWDFLLHSPSIRLKRI